MRPTLPREPHLVLLLVACPALVLAALPVGAPGCGGQWQPRVFEHEWPLVGQHAREACDSCHPVGEPIGPVLAGCVTCHEPDRPEGHHPGQGCGECHRPSGWDDVDAADVDHSFFPLEGSHDVDCQSCHEADTWEGLDGACTSCHATDRPTPHYPGECSDCHVPTRWLEVTPP